MPPKPFTLFLCTSLAGRGCLPGIRKMSPRLYVYNLTTWIVAHIAALIPAAALVAGCIGVEQVEVISEDGSPHGPKCFVLWNPPLTVSQQAVNKGSKMKMSRTEGRARMTKGGISK